MYLMMFTVSFMKFQVLCLIGFIACLPSGFGGGGFVIWVFISALISTIVLFVLKALNIWARFPDYKELYVSIYQL